MSGRQPAVNMIIAFQPGKQHTMIFVGSDLDGESTREKPFELHGDSVWARRKSGRAT